MTFALAEGGEGPDRLLRLQDLLLEVLNVALENGRSEMMVLGGVPTRRNAAVQNVVATVQKIPCGVSCCLYLLKPSDCACVGAVCMYSLTRRTMDSSYVLCFEHHHCHDCVLCTVYGIVV